MTKKVRKSVKKPTKKVRKSVSKKKLQKYWDSLQIYQDYFYDAVASLEKHMEKETGIEGIEFFWRDGYCGIGNIDRTMKLVQFNTKGG